MCGIGGKVVFDRSRRELSVENLQRMSSAMVHRGPDNQGMYVSKSVGLVHRRLSIIDIEGGKQPLSDENNDIWIVFNGEIYNYLDLRRTLSANGHFFRTQSDTEVIIHAYEEYGVEVVSKLRGMFAFAIWDEKKQILILARDRVGIKPLYYHIDSYAFTFASEMKAILADPTVAREIDYAMIDRFLTYNYLPGDNTLIKGLKKLNPGHCLIVENGKIKAVQYWDIEFDGKSQVKDVQDAEARLKKLLRETVEIHLISDVPVGFLLSGGMDSTALLSIARSVSNRNLYSFTIGFEAKGIVDERFYARLAANRFGTKHYDMTITARDFAKALPGYIWHMEEPVCEPPAIALYFISKLAREHVKVLISGEGGDEAFAGYQTYRNLVWLERIKRLMGPLKLPLSEIYGGAAKSFFPFSQRLEKYAPLLSHDLDDYYYSRTSTPFSFFNKTFREFYSKEFTDLTDKAYSTLPTRNCFAHMSGGSALHKMLYTDTKTWLPDDLLVKADKMTMANSVELRVPLLDHEVLEFAASLPASYKLHGLTSKFILRKAFRDNLPQEILSRKKVGFPVPYDLWLKNELHNTVREILLDERAVARGLFQRRAVEKLLKLYCDGMPYSKEIFSLVVLELWQRQFIERERITF